MKKRIIYAGTPDFAVPALEQLVQGQNADYEVVAVYTQPDRPAGRGRKLQPSPVKACALSHDIPVYQPLNFKEPADRQQLADLKPDLMVVAAYGLLLPEAVLNTPSHGCVNLHASLLPRWRGAAPIQRAIEAGDEETGMTLMQMDIGLDTGNMLDKLVTPISAEDTGSSVHDRLAEQGGDILMKNLLALLAGALEGEVQNEADVTYAHKLSKAEALIDWSKAADKLDCQVRAMNPWPVMQTTKDGQQVRIWGAAVVEQATTDSAPGTVLACHKQGLDVATGDGVLRINRLQLPGKKPMDIQAFVNANDWTGLVLGGED